MKKPVAKKLSLELETIANLQDVTGAAGAAGITLSQGLHCPPQSNLLGRTCLLCVPDEIKGKAL